MFDIKLETHTKLGGGTVFAIILTYKLYTNLFQLFYIATFPLRINCLLPSLPHSLPPSLPHSIPLSLPPSLTPSHPPPHTQTDLVEDRVNMAITDYNANDTNSDVNTFIDFIQNEVKFHIINQVSGTSDNGHSIIYWL